MTFTENVISTGIGAFLGFIFAILLFYFTEKWKEDKIRKRLESSVAKELDFNIKLFNQQIGNLNKAIEEVASNNRAILISYGFKNFQSSLLSIYYNSGHAVEKLTSEDILYLSTILDHVQGQLPNLVNDELANWNNGGTSATVTKVLVDERELMKDIVAAYASILTKLEKKK